MNKVKKALNSLDKKTKIYVYIGLGIIVFIIILAVASCSSSSSYMTYEKVEEKMLEATISYLEDNPKNKPKTNEEIVVLAETLVTEEYIKPLEEMLEDGKNCNGKVFVTNSGSELFYMPSLDCGTNYSQLTLANAVLANEDIQTNKEGLYKIDEEYVFKGMSVNNYVQLDEKLWRIMKIDSDSTVHLILDEIGSSMSVNWDESYTVEEERNRGLNNYELSNIKKELEALYQDETFLSADTKSKLTTNSICIGKRGSDQAFTEGKVECNKVIDANIGLINVYDYALASLDATCIKPSDPQCQNYNYLGIQDNWWTLTAVSDNTYSVFSINYRKEISVDDAYSYGEIRPIIYLRANNFVQSGTGTHEDPYKLK